MTINTKFGIGDEVYILYKENGEVKIFKDEILEILITDTQTLYYVSTSANEYDEKQFIPTDLRENVIDKIDELLKEDVCEQGM